MRRIVRRRAIAAAVLLAITMPAATPAAATAPGSGAPTLTAKFVKKELRLTWAFDTGASGRELVVERSIGSRPFAHLTTERAAARRGTYKDRDVSSRFVAYRARATGTSAWSDTLVVDTFSPLASGLSDCPADYGERGLAALNAFRASAGVDASQRRPVTEHIALSRFARHRVNLLAKSRRVVHPPGFSAAAFRSWGYAVWGGGENVVAIGSPEQAVAAWNNSRPHRENNLRRTPDAAFACAVGTDGHNYYLLIMGSTILAPG